MENKNYCAISNIGLRRKNNEDVAYCGISQYGVLLLVADGMGGGRKGEYASKITVDTLSFAFNKIRKTMSINSVKKLIEKNLSIANKTIYNFALKKHYKEIGTTICGAFILEENTFLFSIGDSRILTYKDSYGLLHRTADQSYVELLYESGRITLEEMKNHPQKNLLLNAIGINPTVSHLQTSCISNDEYSSIILCTDGLYNMVDDSKIEEVLKSDKTTEEKGQFLTDLALENGGLDNIALSLWENHE